MPSNYKKQPQDQWEPRYPGENRWPDLKLAEVLARYRKGGISITAMGREFGISCERMRQVLRKAERIEKRPNAVLRGAEGVPLENIVRGENPGKD